MKTCSVPCIDCVMVQEPLTPVLAAMNALMAGRPPVHDKLDGVDLAADLASSLSLDLRKQVPPDCISNLCLYVQPVDCTCSHYMTMNQQRTSTATILVLLQHSSSQARSLPKRTRQFSRCPCVVSASCVCVRVFVCRGWVGG